MQAQIKAEVSPCPPSIFFVELVVSVVTKMIVHIRWIQLPNLG
jgi:hypothetical protein